MQASRYTTTTQGRRAGGSSTASHGGRGISRAQLEALAAWDDLDDADHIAADYCRGAVGGRAHLSALAH